MERLLEKMENLFKLISHVSTIEPCVEFKKALRNRIKKEEDSWDVLNKQCDILHDVITDVFILGYDSRKMIENKDEFMEFIRYVHEKETDNQYVIKLIDYALAF
jgi:hypothetical protein